MNIDQVTELGLHLKQAGLALDQIVASVGQRLDASGWAGDDADRFRNDWWPRHRSHIQSIADDLRGLGQSAINNANEQAAVSDEVCSVPIGAMNYSSGDGGNFSGGSLSAGDTERMIAYLNDVKNIETLRSVYGFAADDIEDIRDLMANGGVIGGKNLPILGAVISGALGGADVALTRELYGGKDARAMWAQVDAGMSIALNIVPGGGLAWTVGTKIGEGLAEVVGAEENGAATFDWKRDQFAGGDYEALSEEEQAAVDKKMIGRYDGWSGFGNFLSDSMDRARTAVLGG